MSTPFTRTLLACAVVLSAASLCATPSAMAAAKKPVKAAPKAPVDPDDPEPDVKGSSVTEFSCELGNKITLFRNDADTGHIALQWKNQLHRLARVTTTTGAERFENKSYGLIWIGIPAKGMLLDSKHNHQLANECRSVEQINSPPPVVIPPAKS